MSVTSHKPRVRQSCVRINGIEFQWNSIKAQRGCGGSIVISGKCGERSPIWDFPTWKAAQAFVSKLKPGGEFEVKEGGKVFTLGGHEVSAAAPAQTEEQARILLQGHA